MQELVARLAARDSEAGAALKVVNYFDKLNEGHVGMETLVRGAAVLSGFPAGLSDPERHLHLRVLPARGSAVPEPPLDPAWATISILGEGPGIAWLETTEPQAIDELILERLAVCVRIVLDRTRRRVVKDDAAALEVLLNPKVTEAVRLEAARRLGLAPTARVRALAVLPESDAGPAAEIGGARAYLEPCGPDSARPRPAGRIGVGRSMPVLEAWKSWEQARIALRFTSPGGEPGLTTVRYATLGESVAKLAETFTADSPVPEDVQRIENAAVAAPWLLETLGHVVMHNSLRAASDAAHLHHSTLQDRVAQAESMLGWPIAEPWGRFRLQFALIAHRLHSTP
jgi:hypothetical protein